jgi:heme exporter protein B
MLFPLVVPVVVAAVKTTSLVMLGDPMNQAGSWLVLLGCFNLIYWSLCGVLFGRVVEA